MFTGLYDSTHGLVDNGLRLAPEHVTLAERLSAAGYHTAGFFGGPYLHPTFGLGDGFDVYESCMTTFDADAGDEAVRRESRSAHSRSHDDVTGPRTVAEVERWADARPADRPFFLFVHLWDVHYDYIPPPPYDTLFDPGYSGPVDGRDFMTDPEVRPRMDPRDLEHLKALYDGEIRFTDANLERLLAALRERGLLEDALVVVTADHGEEFFEHGGKGHQKTLFDEVVRVPLVLWWPRELEGGRVVADQARLVDLTPTILAAAGVRAPSPAQGRDLLPLARGESLGPAPALCELHADGRGFRALRVRGGEGQELKAISYGRAPNGREVPPMGYDLAADPRERAPIPAGQDARVDAAIAELERTREAALALREYLGARSRDLDVDPAMRRRLEELGYLGAGGR
jgi:arylsulfatase A-like enzyme